jgi:hypothetical protein
MIYNARDARDARGIRFLLRKRAALASLASLASKRVYIDINHKPCTLNSHVASKPVENPPVPQKISIIFIVLNSHLNHNEIPIDVNISKTQNWREQ